MWNILNRLWKTIFYLNSFYTLDEYFNSHKVWTFWFITVIFQYKCVVSFNNLNSTVCYSATYKFYYSCLCFSNICLDVAVRVYTFCIWQNFFIFLFYFIVQCTAFCYIHIWTISISNRFSNLIWITWM